MLTSSGRRIGKMDISLPGLEAGLNFKTEACKVSKNAIFCGGIKPAEPAEPAEPCAMKQARDK